MNLFNSIINFLLLTFILAIICETTEIGQEKKTNSITNCLTSFKPKRGPSSGATASRNEIAARLAKLVGQTRKVRYKIDDIEPPQYDGSPCDDFSPDVPNFHAPGRRISEAKCFEYVWTMKYKQVELLRFIKCLILKRRRNLIAGGNDAEAGQYPHMGALGWKANNGTWIFKCGSSLISEKFLLTAAHCSRVSSRDPTVSDPEPKIVRLGGHRLTDYDLDGFPAVDVNIKRFIPHPQYRSPRKYFDIALVELERDVNFEWMIHPACLQSSLALNTDSKATVTGWGVVDLATLRTSPILQVAELDLMASNECNTRLRIGRNRNWRGVVNHQICAGYMAGGIDACMGDSGGPIQMKLNVSRVDGITFPWHIHRVIGVTSFGFGCARANTPAIYTKVASFIDWIEQTVWTETWNRTKQLT